MANLEIETAVCQTHNVHTIAGLDEAGRGALAGPVVAAAVILPLHDAAALARLADVEDSKRLTPTRREQFYALITAHALAYGIGEASSRFIDEHGIIAATKQAMKAAAAQLTPQPDYLLIDGRIRLATLTTPQQAIVRGDSRSLSIAAASILAKVTRDRLMVGLDGRYPRYGFAQHKGYGTALHRTALIRHGPCPQHRFSFAPIRPTLIKRT